MITWITENVSIGEYTDTVNEELLMKEKIDCVLNVREKNTSAGALWERLGIFYMWSPVGIGLKDCMTQEDINRYCKNNHGWKIELKIATARLGLLAQEYEKILVHCTAGIDRSPFIVAMYLTGLHKPEIRKAKLAKQDRHFWLSRAYAIIKEKRPQICEHYEWL